MNYLLPAALAAVGVAIAVGFPAPIRPGVLPYAERARWEPSAPFVAVVALAVLVYPLGPVGAGVGAVLAGLGRRAMLGRRVDKARQEERVAAAEAMATLAAELRAGRAPDAALVNAGQVAKGRVAMALTEAGGAIRLGEQAGDVLVRHAPESAVPDLLRGLAVCWSVCQGAGSSLAAAVDRLEQALREQAALREELDTELAGARSTALLICFMPAFGLALGAGLGGNPINVLLHTPIGWGCLVGGVGLELAGLAWTAAIVRSAGGSR